MRFDSLIIGLLVLCLVGTWILSGMNANKAMFPSATNDTTFNVLNKYDNTTYYAGITEKSIGLNKSGASDDTITNNLIQSSLDGLYAVKDAVGIFPVLIDTFVARLQLPPIVSDVFSAALIVLVVFMIISLFWRPWLR